MQKVKVNDEVVVLAGKDKGRKGKVLKLINKEEQGQKVIVEGINLVKKHVKPNPNRNIEGGIIEKAAPIHISNVALFHAATGKGQKTGIKTLEDGRKVRYFKVDNELVDL